MAIHQLKKQSDLEKRLKLLRNQLYGKQSSAFSFQSSDKTTDTLTRRSTESYSDISYLNQDLLKILILSALALGSQFILLSLNLF